MHLPFICCLRHPPGKCWGPFFASHNVLIFWILLYPVSQGLIGFLLMASVGVTHSQGHQSFQVVWLQFQAPRQKIKNILKYFCSQAQCLNCSKIIHVKKIKIITVAVLKTGDEQAPKSENPLDFYPGKLIRDI